MYLPQEFISHVRWRFRHAHKGNVTQLLEALNKLAGIGELKIEVDHAENQTVCYYLESGTLAKTPVSCAADDVACMNLCKWAGSLIQALRGRGELV
ncbi:MAG: hypothetical protein [Bacteriophage sp.]|nr:MAG: hypothetical protein [Bacteriophage sp.]